MNYLPIPPVVRVPFWVLAPVVPVAAAVATTVTVGQAIRHRKDRG